MNLVFGPVPEEYQYPETFKGINGEGKVSSFYFKFEVNEEDEMFTIRDTCDRFVPVDFENLDDLITVLLTLREYKDDKQEFQKYWDARFAN